jgi:hypothetical protein
MSRDGQRRKMTGWRAVVAVRRLAWETRCRLGYNREICCATYNVVTVSSVFTEINDTAFR